MTTSEAERAKPGDRIAEMVVRGSGQVLGGSRVGRDRAEENEGVGGDCGKSEGGADGSRIERPKAALGQIGAGCEWAHRFRADECIRSG